MDNPMTFTIPIEMLDYETRINKLEQSLIKSNNATLKLINVLERIRPSVSAFGGTTDLEIIDEAIHKWRLTKDENNG